MNKTIAYHFLPIIDGVPTMRHSGIKVLLNKRYSVRGGIVPCYNGLHASLNLRDALHYTQRDTEYMLCKVEVGGTILHRHDKLAARYRKVLVWTPATPILQEFSCWCAEQSLATVQASGTAVDQRSLDAVRLVRKWLVNPAQVTHEELKAAARVAYAAYAAARDNDAARAAYAAARAAYAADAAYAAADAAYAAARDNNAAYAARADDEEQTQETKLRELFEAAISAQQKG